MTEIQKASGTIRDDFIKASPNQLKNVTVGILSSEKSRFRTHKLPFLPAPTHNYFPGKCFFLSASGSEIRAGGRRGDSHTHFGNV